MWDDSEYKCKKCYRLAPKGVEMIDGKLEKRVAKLEHDLIRLKILLSEILETDIDDISYEEDMESKTGVASYDAGDFYKY